MGEGIHQPQVSAMARVIEQARPDLYDWFIDRLEYAVTRGWLKVE